MFCLATSALVIPKTPQIAMLIMFLSLWTIGLFLINFQYKISLNEIVDIQSFPPLPSYLSDQGTIWPDQLDLSAFQKPKYHLSKCSFDLIQTNRVESNSILMSSSSSPIQNFWDHFVENFNISQRAKVLLLLFHLIWTHWKGIDPRYKTEKFWNGLR